MGEREYQLIYIRVNGGRAVGFSSIAPSWLNIVLGLAAILTGALILVLPSRGTSVASPAALYVFGVVFVVAGAISLTLRASFILEPENRIWRERLTVAGFGRRRKGSFDDAIGIQLVPCENRGRVFLAIVWRWKDEQRAAMMLAWFSPKD